MSTFLADMIKNGYTEDEVFGVLFDSERERKRRRLQAIVIEEVAAQNLKKINELLTYQELAIWRRENGFERVVEGEESCFMFIARFRPLRSNTMPACGLR